MFLSSMTTLPINKYTPNKFFFNKKIIFFYTKRYKDFIISSGKLYNQNIDR